MVDFLESRSLPPEYLKNTIISAIRKTIAKDKRAADTMINRFESYWVPKNGSLTISTDVYGNPLQARQLTLENRYFRIKVIYQVAQNIYHPYVKHWLVHGAPFTEREAILP